jgi:hypothetical protein
LLAAPIQEESAAKDAVESARDCDKGDSGKDYREAPHRLPPGKWSMERYRNHSFSQNSLRVADPDLLDFGVGLFRLGKASHKPAP